MSERLRLSRHARRRMQLYGITADQIDRAVHEPVVEVTDDHGGRRCYAAHPTHRYIRVILAADDPEFVVSVHPRRTLPMEEQQP